MTCIAGIADQRSGRVYLGGDSAATGTSQQTIRADSKVFFNGACVFGCTSSFRMVQLLRYALEIPPYEETIPIENYMATRFINAVRTCLKEGGYATKEDEQEKGGKFLVGIQKRLFCIDADYQVQEALIGYDAVGAGDDLALGVLFATRHGDLPPEARIALALEAASYHNASVRPPFVIESR